MATIYNMATDWTYDEFIEDSKAYNATPMKGVYANCEGNYRKYFMVSFKNFARDFKERWISEYEHLYVSGYGWIGDAFAHELGDWNFSDFYKDAYGQRPHLPSWFYIQAVGLPTSEDIFRTFCATPVEDAMRWARETRENF